MWCPVCSPKYPEAKQKQRQMKAFHTEHPGDRSLAKKKSTWTVVGGIFNHQFRQNTRRILEAT